LITGRRENIADLLGNRLFSFHEVDIATPEFFEAFKEVPVNYIYNLACPTGVPNLTTLAEEMMRSCSFGVFNVFEIAKIHKARVLYSSTAEIYGDPERFPQDENYYGNVDPTGPRSAYEEGKRFGEATAVMYVRKYGVDAVIVRIFNTYGPGMSLDDQRVIPQFIKSVRDKLPFRIYGTGSQTRSHLYVDDLINGLITVMEKGTTGEVYNVGSEHPMTIKELAEMVVEMTRHGAGISFVPHFIADHNGRHPSVEKVKSLGWSQKVHIKDGLLRMIGAYLVPEKQVVAEGASIKI
ncbi:MAG TPA: NAD-dependent epimerase/dehydratase family protein, partial [Candidatus Paceibacterota bacterium]|nr:NAD-dependent epimerase/dehydratase family protein [Candidatus Paceibacterota bacterium]